MKIRLTTLLLCLANLSYGLATADNLPILQPAWQTDAIFEQPESVVYDQQRKLLYVSNVNGQPTEADGKGYLSQLAVDGSVIKQHWIDGLDAPKGMAIVGDTLYVADITQLVAIDIKSGKISQRYPAAEAIFLNDIAADADGNIYVSDMMTDQIYRLSKGKFTSWIKNKALAFPNGLLVENNQLIVGSWGVITEGFVTDIPGHLKTISLNDKSISSLGNGTPVGNLDGVESDSNGNYYVTDWMRGTLLHITPKGEAHTLIAFRQAGSADHEVVDDLIIVPMMLDGTVLAYQVK